MQKQGNCGTKKKREINVGTANTSYANDGLGGSLRRGRDEQEKMLNMERARGSR